MCRCVVSVNDLLADNNTRIERIFLISKGEGIGIRTEKVVKKKRQGPTVLFATFCPFCGERLTPKAGK